MSTDLVEVITLLLITYALAPIDKQVNASCTRFSSFALLPSAFESAMVVENGKEESCVCYAQTRGLRVAIGLQGPHPAAAHH